MDQVTKMMIDTNNMLLDANKVESPEQRLNIKINIINAQVKVVNAVVQMHTSIAKNKRAMRNFERMNLMDGTTAVDLLLGDPEVDKVKCPVQNALILRAECLDYSGSHMDDCQGCEIGLVTKQRLLPE